MVSVDYSPLDRPEISMNSFYPRQNWTATPDGAEDHTVTVEGGINLSCRFFPVSQENPTILFFYGNGETAADYDNIAPIYNQVGVNFFVADYRGYGNSGGSPAFQAMLSDAREVLTALRQFLQSSRYTCSIFVMGRSMGRHAAFELAANCQDQIEGLIIESGRPTLGQFTHGLPDDQASTLEAAYQAKVRSIDMPVLVIHGEADTLAPLQDATRMFQEFPSAKKTLLTIPGAGHNDLLYLGITEYFAAIVDFVSPPSE